MRTMRKINKPIKFFGLSSGQFAVFMLVVALIIIFSIFKQLHPIHHHRDYIKYPRTFRSIVWNTEKRA
mgnify:CR=1 FL=1